MNSLRKWPLLLASSVLVAACGTNTGEDDVSGNDSAAVDTATMNQRLNTQIVFYNVPSPVETSQLLRDAGADYDASMTNDPLVFKTYVSEEARAVNLGVYGADLSFAGVFENTQESMSFLKCVNSLSKELGIVEAFDEKTADRLERNKNDRDSILEIVSNSFWEADSYLKENGRQSTSTLIVAGGWVEGMYIASQVYGKTKENQIRKRITSDPQYNSLKSLVSLMESGKIKNETQFILDGLKKIKAAYDKIPTGKVQTITQTDTVHHETYVETKNERTADDATFGEIAKAIEDLRTQMIKMK